MDRLRAALLLVLFFSVTLVMIPVQWTLLRIGSSWAGSLPHGYHRFMCWLLGVRLRVDGTIRRDQPVLILSNHISWLDIIVISAVAPVQFVAKSEVRAWPFFGLMARLQRTVFIDRSRRSAVRLTAQEIAARLAAGERVVLFAEGTSSDGNRILPFKSALIGAAALAATGPGDGDGKIGIQTLTLAYTRVHGLPMSRLNRAHVAWYGDMDMLSHVWGLLRQGPIDAQIRISEPLHLSDVRDRKRLAFISEAQIRQNFSEIITARPLP
jgi:1-acyl-sn-glycerol-3-phosphate acyltransferase